MRLVRIAFRCVLLLAATFSPCGRLRATHVEAVFDAALTNGTGWVYGPGVHIKKDNGHPYIYARSGGFITSPKFDFAITSVTVEAWNSGVTTSRQVELMPSTPSGFRGEQPPAIHHLDLTNSARELTFAWSRESAVQALTLRSSESGVGNVYFRSIAIDGTPLTPMPTNLSVDAVYGESFVARWENGEGIRSNRLTVSRKDLKVFVFARSRGQPTNISVNVLGPQFDGENLYSATNADGVVQIGTGEKPGWLSYSDSDSFRNRQLVLTVQHYPHKEEAKHMMLRWTLDGETNDVARVDLEAAPRDRTVNLSSVPDGATLLICPPRKRNARILLSRFGFVSPVASHVIPAPGTACRRRFRVTGLTLETDYDWTVSSFADDGTESPDAAPVSVRTNDLPPPGLVIRLR